MVKLRATDIGDVVTTYTRYIDSCESIEQMKIMKEMMNNLFKYDVDDNLTQAINLLKTHYERRLKVIKARDINIKMLVEEYVHLCKMGIGKTHDFKGDTINNLRRIIYG